MSQSTRFTITTPDMADSITPQPSWLPLIQPALSHQVVQKGSCVSPDTNCAIVYGPEVGTMSCERDKVSAN